MISTQGGIYVFWTIQYSKVYFDGIAIISIFNKNNNKLQQQQQQNPESFVS